MYQLWLIIRLPVYCTFRELVLALGRERVISMFFDRDTERERTNHERSQRQISGKISRIGAIVSLRLAYRWAPYLFSTANFARGG